MKFIPIYISPELKCQTSLPESRSVYPSGNSSRLYTGHDVLWCGTSLWLIQANSPSYPPFQFLLCTSFFTDKEKSP